MGPDVCIYRQDRHILQQDWTKYERVRAIFGPDGGFMDMIGYLGTDRSIYGQDRYILEPDGTNYGWVRTILGPDGYDQFGNR